MKLITQPGRPATSSKHVPLPQNPGFVGRTEELKLLKQKVFKKQGCRQIAVVGAAGVGKTQLVLHFVYSVLDQRPDTPVFWVSTASADTWRLSYAEVAKELEVDLTIEREDDQWELHQLQAYITSRRGDKWLLVVDNADDFDVLGSPGNRNGITESPTMPISGWTVITTRNRDIIQPVTDCETIELAQMNGVDAMAVLDGALVTKCLPDERLCAKEVLIELDHLPFTIAQAAAYINRGKISISKFLDALRNSRSDMAATLALDLFDLMGTGQSAYAVARTLLMSLEQVLRMDRPAAELLQFLSCIGWESVPRDIIPRNLAGSVDVLCSYSFLTRRNDPNVFDMHRLTHLAIQARVCHDEPLAKTQAEALQHLLNMCTSRPWANGGNWRTLMPHLAGIDKLSKGIDVGTQAELYLLVGRFLVADRRLKEGARWQEKSRELAMVDVTNRLTPRGDTSLTKSRTWQPQKATKLLEELSNAQSRAWGYHHPYTLSSQHSLALAYHADNQPNRAEKLLEKVVKMQEQKFGKDNPVTVLSLRTLGLAYQATGQLKRAEDLLEEVIEVQTKTLGEAHPHTLSSQTSLALLCQANGQHQKAVRILESVVAAYAMVLRQNHPQLILLQCCLAFAYQANGQSAEATRLTLLSHVTAEDHPSPLKTLGPIKVSMLDTVNSMDTPAGEPEPLGQAFPVSGRTHLGQMDNPNPANLYARGHEQTAETPLRKGVEAFSSSTASTTASSTISVPLGAASLAATGAMSGAGILAAKLFAVDIPQRKIAERLAGSEKIKAHAEMQKAIESKMNLINSELQHSLKLEEAKVALKEEDLQRRRSDFAASEARWAEKIKSLEQEQMDLDKEVKEHRMSKSEQQDSLKSKNEELRQRDEVIAELKTTIDRLERTIDENSKSLALKTQELHSRAEELQHCNDIVYELETGKSRVERTLRNKSESLDRLGILLKERDQTVTDLETSIAGLGHGSDEQALSLARKVQELQERDQRIIKLETAARLSDQEMREKAVMLAQRDEELHDREERLNKFGVYAEFLLGSRKLEMTGNAVAKSDGGKNDDGPTDLLGTCGLIFGRRRQRTVLRSDPDKSERSSRQLGAASIGSQVAVGLSPIVPGPDSDTASKSRMHSEFHKQIRRFSVRPELVYTMWSPNTEKLVNALKSNKGKLRGVRNRLHAVEEELAKCQDLVQEAIVGDQDWHDDLELDDSDPAETRTRSSSAQTHPSHDGSYSPLAPNQSLAPSEVFLPNAAFASTVQAPPPDSGPHSALASSQSPGPSEASSPDDAFASSRFIEELETEGIPLQHLRRI